MKRGGKNKTRHRNTLEMKAEKRTAMSACKHRNFTRHLPSVRHTFSGRSRSSPRVLGRRGGGAYLLYFLLYLHFGVCQRRSLLGPDEANNGVGTQTAAQNQKKLVDNETGK